MRKLAILTVVLFAACGGGTATTDDDARDQRLQLEEFQSDAVPLDPVLGHPHDGRLCAAAGSVVITPNEENHPCPLYLGGTGQNRLSEGVHDDLEARILVLAQDDLHVVLVSMDLVGLEWPDTLRMKAKLAQLGLEPNHLVVSCTHTHTGPDTIGVWGPKDGVSGQCPAYNDFLAQALQDRVAALKGELQPVHMALGEKAIDEPLSNEPSLLLDSRLPVVVNNRVTAARFVTPEGATVATVVNWHNHPETMITHNIYSADFPRWTRNALEDQFGGTAVYFSGTVGGLMTPIDVAVRRYTEDGQQVLAPDGAPEMVTSGGEEQAWSLGHIVAEVAIDSLEDSAPQEVSLAVDRARIEIPVDSIVLIAAFASGVLETNPELITGDAERCGPYGCAPADLHHIQLGSLHIGACPGEVFPETSGGRPETTVDWGERTGESWPPWTYPAMVGYRNALPQAHYLMELGLANQELGYVVPESDLLPGNHPDNYAEYFCISPRAEAMIRGGIESLLSGR